MNKPVSVPVCDFACDQPAVGVVPTTNPDKSIRRRPICDHHVKELLPEEPGGWRTIQMFGALAGALLVALIRAAL